MAKFELKFLDLVNTGEYIEVNVFQKNNTEKVISITGMHEDRDFCIWLDKSTAIKFAKTLRTEINKITEREGLNE